MHVARKIVQPWQAALIAKRLHRLGDASRVDAGRLRRALGCLATAQGILGGELQMEPQFLLQVAIIPASAEGSPEPPDPLAEGGHSHSPFELSLVAQQRVHDRRHAIPLRLLGGELPAPGDGDFVEARLPVGVGYVPLGTYQAALFQSHQSRVKRPHIDLECAGGHLF
jgi:hypothetical protein